jgi:hypothetical protein
MIKNAISKKIILQNVLADSWFISDDFFKGISKIATKAKTTFDVIGLMKANRTLLINDKSITASQMPVINTRKEKACRNNSRLIFSL